jgi:hypothetical protein
VPRSAFSLTATNNLSDIEDTDGLDLEDETALDPVAV